MIYTISSSTKFILLPFFFICSSIRPRYNTSPFCSRLTRSPVERNIPGTSSLSSLIRQILSWPPTANILCRDILLLFWFIKLTPRPELVNYQSLEVHKFKWLKINWIWENEAKNIITITKIRDKINKKYNFCCHELKIFFTCNFYSAGIYLNCQNLRAVDIRFWRLKSIPAQ